MTAVRGDGSQVREKDIPVVQNQQEAGEDLYIFPKGRESIFVDKFSKVSGLRKGEPGA